MPNEKPASAILSYASPNAERRIRYTICAIASIVVTFLSALFAALTTFREGLTSAEVHCQILIGRVSGTVGGLVALALALVSYRQRASNHALSHVAIALAVIAIFYTIVTLPPW